MLNDKKIKEIKQYAKDDVKYWVREFKREKTEEEKERFENEYPEGITSYYKKIVFSNEAQKERLIKLNKIAIQQMSILQDVEKRKLLK